MIKSSKECCDDETTHKEHECTRELSAVCRRHHYLIVVFLMSPGSVEGKEIVSLDAAQFTKCIRETNTSTKFGSDICISPVCLRASVKRSAMAPGCLVS